MVNEEVVKSLIDRTAFIMMREGLFSVDIPDDVARGMKRETYYEVKSWLRGVKRAVVLEANTNG